MDARISHASPKDSAGGESDGNTAVSQPAVKRSSTDPEALAGVRVLVLDDDEGIRRTVTALLTRCGCEVQTATNGREGLRLMLEHDYDVVLVDLRMPEMGGAAFIKEVRAIWPWLGVLVMTGYADEEAIEYLQDSGFLRVIQKPFEMSALRRYVAEAAQNKRRLVEVSVGQTLDLITYQMGLLREFSETAVVAQNVTEAMRALAAGLSRILPCLGIGILIVEEEGRELLLATSEPVASSFLQAVRMAAISHYEALTGETIPPADLRVQVVGPAASETAQQSLGSTFISPIIIAQKVRGVLVLASASANAFTQKDLPFLYHAGSHLSTVFLALSRLRQMAVRDALTGLYNRRGLEEEYRRAWQLTRRHGHELGVVVIDIDHFKTLNDAYGHQAGDQILQEFGRLLHRVARASDIIGRYGGDEIVVVLPISSPEQTRAFAERLLKEVRQQVFCRETHGIRLTISVGVANSDRLQANQTAAEVLRQADQAVYAAKRGGRDRLCVWKETLGQEGGGVETSPSPKQLEENSASPPVRGRVLVVDDEAVVANLVKAVLQREQYEVVVENSVPAALDRLRQSPGQFDIVLTDLAMPGYSGYELLDHLRGVDESIVRIVITGRATTETAVASVRHGAYDFLAKPFVPAQLTAVVDRALQYRRLLLENRRYHSHLEEMIRTKSLALSNALEQIKKAYDFTLGAMAALIDAREHGTGRHCEKVSRLSRLLAANLGLPDRLIDEIGRGALLHDIGKIGIPDAILLKAGPLDEKEWSIMRTHPEIGHRILSGSPHLEGVAEIVLAHHEWYDGSGYPRGLAGEAICQGARVFSIIDVYDAIRSDRPYAKGRSRESALREIESLVGRQFDPWVAEGFFRCVPEIEKVAEYGAGDDVSNGAHRAD